MSSFIRVCVFGHLAADPIARTTKEGQEIVTFTVATSEHWKGSDGEKKERVEWHRIAVFNNKLGLLAKTYLKKGHKVYVEGSLQTRKWTDKDGNEKHATDIVLQNYNGRIELMEARVIDSEPEEPKPFVDNFDDLPF